VLRLLGAAGHAEGEAGQDDLFGGEAAPMPVEAAKGQSGPKGGRPAGARNRSTDEWVRLFLSRHRAPMEVLGAIYSRPWQDLYTELQAEADKHRRWRETTAGGYWEVIAINPLDVLKLQSAAAQALLPYVHKQQARAVEVTESRRGLVILGDALGEADDAVTDDGGLNLPPP